MTEDSEILSLDLANNFPGAEKIQTRNKKPTPKNIQVEGRQSDNGDGNTEVHEIRDSILKEETRGTRIFKPS